MKKNKSKENKRDILLLKKSLKKSIPVNNTWIRSIYLCRRKLNIVFETVLTIIVE